MLACFALYAPIFKSGMLIKENPSRCWFMIAKTIAFLSDFHNPTHRYSLFPLLSQKKRLARNPASGSVYPDLIVPAKKSIAA